jgi:hypothetical protein
MRSLLFALTGVAFLSFNACSSSTPSSPAPPDAGSEGASTDAQAEAPGPNDGTSGAPCTADTECQGANARCIKTLAGKTFPDGYCSSDCDPTKNQGDGRNDDCPGRRGACDGAQKACFMYCTGKNGSLPCRTGYLCAFGASGDICVPESYSQCDPTKSGGCPDAGTCKQAGADPIGRCE